MAFPPFMSLLLRSPYPTEKGQCNERTFLILCLLSRTALETALNATNDAERRRLDARLPTGRRLDWIQEPSPCRSAIVNHYNRRASQQNEAIHQRGHHFVSKSSTHQHRLAWEPKPNTTKRGALHAPRRSSAQRLIRATAMLKERPSSVPQYLRRRQHLQTPVAKRVTGQREFTTRSGREHE